MTKRDTQLAAYFDMIDRLPVKRKAVYDAIAAAADGATLFELAAVLHWPINCVSGRVTELAEVGVVKDIGERRTNPQSGKDAIVWRPRVEKPVFQPEFKLGAQEGYAGAH